MSKFEDIADFVEKGHLLSDSEFDDEETHVVLPQNLRRGNLADNKSSLRLHEIGPRVTMRLMKIEEDLLTGEVLYHDYIQKNAIEVEELRKKRAAKKRLKEQRKEKQEENKKKKDVQKAEHKAKTSGGTLTDRDKQLLKDAEEAIGEQSDEDDTRYYEDAIGEAPEKELFQGQSGTRKRPFIPKGSNYSLKPKKPKLDKKKEYDEDDRDDRRGRAGPGKKGKGSFKGKGTPSKKGGKFSGKKTGGDYKGKSKYAGKKGEGKGQGKPKFKGGKRK